MSARSSLAAALFVALPWLLSSLTMAAEIDDPWVLDGDLVFLDPAQPVEIDGPPANDARLTLKNNSSLHGVQDLYVGLDDTGTLQILSGSSLETDGDVYLGYNAGSTGTATISGDDSEFEGDTWTEDLYVGYSGGGTLVVNDGGILRSFLSAHLGNNTGSTGTVIISGSGSLWDSGSINVGVEGSGALRIENGGSVSSVFVSARIGFDVGSTGSVVVTGAGSKWELQGGEEAFGGTIYVGLFGDGMLRVENGGEVKNGLTTIGSGEGAMGTATVTGTGSKWNCGTLDIGFDSDDATLLIENGGEVTASRATISDGTATATGATSKWTLTNALEVGYVSDDAVLHIEDGAQVTSARGDVAGIGENTTGTVNITAPGSKWTISDEGLRLGASDLDIDPNIGGTGTINVSNVGSLEVEGLTELWDHASITLSTGSSAALEEVRLNEGGALQITNSHVTSVDGHVGTFGGLAGVSTATVSGTGSMWKLSGDLNVGGSGAAGGAGSVVIQNSGDLEVAGTLAIWDQASVEYNGGWLILDSGGANAAPQGVYVGLENGGNAITVAEGGQFSSVLNSYVGYGGGAGGHVTVSGAGSKWTGFSDFFGYSGTGVLNLTGGGEMADTDAYLGYNAGSVGVANISGAGSKWTTTGTLYAGLAGAASLWIEEGGKAAGSIGRVGWSAGSIGVATITGAGSAWELNSLSVGDFGYGEVRLLDGGAVQTSHGYVGDGAGSTGIATISGAGSNWTTSTLRIGNGGTGTLNVVEGGTVSITFGAEVRAGGTVKVDGGSVLGSVDLVGGQLAGDGSVVGTVWNAGTVAPGNSAGTLSITGPLVQYASGTLEIELGGTAAGEFDVLAVSGLATLNGTIDFDLIGGFQPSLGDNFNVLFFGSRGGDFATYADTDVGGFLELRPKLLADRLQLRTRPQQDGDINTDGTVDIFDVGEVSDFWEAAGPQGDVNDDGSVDIFDVGEISDHWMDSIGGDSAPAEQVPEPSTIALAVVALTSCLARARLRRR